jgi:ribosomal protein S18 acetylase RimI-like enzyme
MFMAALSAESMSPSGFVRTVVANAVERLGPFDRREKPVIMAGGETPAFLVRPTGPEDRGEILRFVEATGCFRTDEMIVAGEVLDDALVKGQKGYYQSLTAESNGRAVGWICFGPTPCTHGTYDIYWMIVASEFQKKGIGTTLLKQAERIISQRGGRLVVIETPSRNLYEPAHRLYRSAGYSEQARIEEFFAEGDDKIIFTRQLAD